MILGRPIPQLIWRKNGVMVEPYREQVNDDETARQSLLIRNVERQNLNSILTCSATNSLKTKTTNTSVKLDLNSK